ncbi:MAG: phosphatase PAP2 family protein [Actinomycetota bacterium]
MNARFDAADLAALRFLRTTGHTPRAERAVAGFSRLGEHAGIWLAIGIAGIAVDAPRRARWRGATATVVCSYLLNTALKLSVRRRRPEIDGLQALTTTPTALSFPSAHATTSFAGAAAFAPLLPSARTPLILLASALATSRLYLGVHWPSDVLVGGVLGTVVGRVRG